MYNFCCEPGRGYPEEVFWGRMERFPFRDHCAPPLKTMIYFGNSLKRWLDDDIQNVITLHCKAGKGRAGLMACVAMFRIGMFQTMEECMAHYDRVRVDNGRGLTVRSQRRYALMYERLWRDVWHVNDNVGDAPGEERSGELYPIPKCPELSLVAVEVRKLPEGFRNRPCLRLFQGSSFEPKKLSEIQDAECDERGTILVELAGRVKGNYKVDLRFTDGSKLKKGFEFWNTTFFTDVLENNGTVHFTEEHCDIKRRKRVLFQESEFELILHFDPTHIVYEEEEPSIGDKDNDIHNEILPSFSPKETEMVTLTPESEEEGFQSPGSSMDLSLTEHAVQPQKAYF